MAMGITVTDYDREVYAKELKDFLPDSFIDVHVHLWKKEFMRKEDKEQSFGRGCVSWPSMVAEDCTYEDCMQSFAQFFPGKKVLPVLTGKPNSILPLSNAYINEIHNQTGLPALYVTAWDTPPEEIEKKLTTGGFCGIKPYISHVPDYIPTKEVRIFDFLPHEHLEVVDKLGGIVLLHISRDARLRDPLNLAQLMEIERKYKNLKLIVAHIGRAYSKEDLEGTFEVLGKTENMLFDFTANVLDLAMIECLRAVGSKRLMFGSDMPIIKMRMYRTTENGFYYNYVPRGLYGDVSGDPHMREVDYPEADRITSFMYEELLAFKRASRELKLTDAQIEDIMCNNAAKLFKMENMIRA